jgi:AhpD family alkylhydroperoxidase
VIRYIRPIRPSDAMGLLVPIYSQIKMDFGRVVEPFLLHSPIPELLAGAWMACRETELVGVVPRNVKESVAIAISVKNKCPYCIDAHTIMLQAGGEKEMPNSVIKGKYGKIEDKKTRTVLEWLQNRLDPKPFSRQEAPEIIGTAVYFHYINRISNVLLGETPLPTNQRLLKRSMLNVATQMFSSAVKRPKTIGNSLKFLPQAELPEDLAWAKDATNVAGAFSRFDVAVEGAGEVGLAKEVRLEVDKRIDAAFTGNGEAELVDFDDQALNSAAELSFLTAVSTCSVDDKVILAFRRHHPEDTQLLGALSWASFAAAKKIGCQLAIP